MRRTSVQRAGVFLLFVAVSLLTRLALLTVPILNIDESSYIVGSWEILSGKLPYTAFGDNKPPLVYLYYALAQLLFGRGMLAVRLVTTLCTIPLTAYAISSFFGHDRRGVIGGLTFLVYSAAFRGHEMAAVNCEILMLLPLSWAVVHARSEDARSTARLAGVGALIGVATLFKYQAASWLLAVAVPVVLAAWPRERVRGAVTALAALGAGFAAPLALTSIAFVALGGGADFLYWNVLHNLDYAANPTTVGLSLARANESFGPWLLVTSPLWVASFVSIRAEASSYRRQLFAGLIMASLFSASIGFRFFPHYFVQLYVPLALAAAPAIAHEFRRPVRAQGWLLASYSAAVLIAFTASNIVRFHEGAEVHMETRPVFHDVATRLREDGCFGSGPLFVWGNSSPLFHYQTGLPVASRFFFPESPLVGFVAGNPSATRLRAAARQDEAGREWDWLMSDLRRHRPTYILDTSPAALDNWRYFPLERAPRLQRLVRWFYVRLDQVDGVVIYKRRSCGAPGTRGVFAERLETEPEILSPLEPEIPEASQPAQH